MPTPQAPTKPRALSLFAHTERFAKIAVPVPVRATWTYAVPGSLKEQLQVGHAVAVSFSGRTLTGYVVGWDPEPAFERSKIKPVIRLMDPEPVFNDEQLSFFQWMANYYLVGLGEVISTALPSAIKASVRTVYHATSEGVDALADGTMQDDLGEVLREVVARPGLTKRGLARRLREFMESEEAQRALDKLKRKGWILTEEERRGAGAYVRTVKLLIPPTELLERCPRAGRRQREVVDALAAAGGALDMPLLVAEQGPYAREAVKKLVAAEVLAIEPREIRDPVTVGELPAKRAPPTLTAAQRGAVDKILGPPRPWLLHGVTGAGKTEVYLHAAAEVLKRGQQVLVLVPEIGLTPLLTGRFRARFGDAIAVLHSGLTGAQRLREWRRIRAGEAQVAVGARSALFAPFHDLGLLVVDEEHDGSYKQDEGVRYNARDLSVVRSKLASCPLVLGSATPSMETYQNAMEDRYGLLELLERPTPQPVPTLQVVDMNREPRVDGKVPLLSGAVREALAKCFAEGGKAIVLYNRRGYATFVQCPDCGGAYSCPSCGVGLVLHLKQRTLTCHYCGFHRPFSHQCPACDGNLEILGRGTERVEEQLRTAFPGIAIGRMDADTTSVRGSHHRLLEQFRTGETRMLLGTQIVAKGHDFPDVRVAVVVGADHVLMMPDFRAAERTFSLLTQLAGRAGRGDVAGRVLVQTHHPDHFVFKLLQDYRTFHGEESRQRRMLRYPPFARLVLIRVESSKRDAAVRASVELGKRLRAAIGEQPVQVLGPVPAALPRLVGRWRFQLLIRGERTPEFRVWMRERDLSMSRAQGVRVVVDVDPRHLM